MRIIRYNITLGNVRESADYSHPSVDIVCFSSLCGSKETLLDISFPRAVPVRVLFEIARNYITIQFGKAESVRKSAFRLQDVLLDYLGNDLSDIVKKYENTVLNLGNQKIPRMIWTLWWQGGDSMNEVVAGCIRHLSSVPGYEVHVLTKDNVQDYIDISDIRPLFRPGHIYVQQLSDVIRFRLLRKYGGFWFDASMFLYDKSYPDYIVENYQFFSGKRKDYDSFYNVAGAKCSTYFWASVAHHPFFEYLDEGLTSFITRHKGVIDYTQTDYTIELGYRNIRFIKETLDSVPYNNQAIWSLDGLLNLPFDSSQFDDIVKKAHLFKFSSHTFNRLIKEGGFPPGSFWKVISERYIGR